MKYAWRSLHHVLALSFVSSSATAGYLATDEPHWRSGTILIETTPNIEWIKPTSMMGSGDQDVANPLGRHDFAADRVSGYPAAASIGGVPYHAYTLYFALAGGPWSGFDVETHFNPVTDTVGSSKTDSWPVGSESALSLPLPGLVVFASLCALFISFRERVERIRSARSGAAVPPAHPRNPGA